LLLRFVKSEVETFTGVDLASNCLLEIFVWDNAVFIKVEFIEYRHKLFLGKCDTPMLEVIL
jgi:hypothetical protein